MSQVVVVVNGGDVIVVGGDVVVVGGDVVVLGGDVLGVGGDVHDVIVVVGGGDRDHGSGVWDHGKMMLTKLTASLQSNTCNYYIFIIVCPV